ncbi:MAG: hypothetical protein ACLFVC_06615 [Opitutales bacterium]
MNRFKHLCRLFAVLVLSMQANLLPAQQSEDLDQLSRYLTSEQRASLLEAEALIREGESEVTSGRHFAERKPSRLNPKEDTEAIKERGKKMIAEGEAKIAEGEKILDELKAKALAQREEAIKQRVRTYEYSPARLSFDDAIEAAADEVLRAAWDANYEALLYDGFFLTDSETTRRADTTTHNSIYDLLVDLDGTNFTVNVPLDLSLDVDPEDGAYQFTFDNESAFEGKRTALLAMELILGEESSEALLSVAAIDLKTRRVLAQSLRSVTDPAAVVEKAAPSDGPEVAKPAGAVSEIPLGGVLTDPESSLESMAALETPYRYRIDASKADSTFKSRVLHALLSTLILEHTDINLVDNAFIRRAYVDAAAEMSESEMPESESDEKPEATDGAAASDEEQDQDSDVTLEDESNAILALFPRDAAASYDLRAKAKDQDRVIDVGVFELTYPADEADPEPESE